MPARTGSTPMCPKTSQPRLWSSVHFSTLARRMALGPARRRASTNAGSLVPVGPQTLPVTQMQWTPADRLSSSFRTFHAGECRACCASLEGGDEALIGMVAGWVPGRLESPGEAWTSELFHWLELVVNRDGVSGNSRVRMNCSRRRRDRSGLPTYQSTTQTRGARMQAPSRVPYSRGGASSIESFLPSSMLQGPARMCKWIMLRRQRVCSCQDRDVGPRGRSLGPPDQAGRPKPVTTHPRRLPGLGGLRGSV